MRKRNKSVDDEKHEGAGAGATGAITFLVSAAIVAYLFLTNGDWKPQETYWFINTGLCLWVPLVVIMFVLRQEPAQFGMQRGDSRFGAKSALLLWMAMLIPAAIAASRPEFRLAYTNRLSAPLWGFGQPFNPLLHRVNGTALLYYELSMGFYMFCWEFFFRGFLLFGLQKTRLGSVGAVIVQTIPFILLHWSMNPGASKPYGEIIGSAIAAPVLGLLAIRARSFVYGFVAHWAVSLTFDLFILAPFMFRHFG